MTSRIRAKTADAARAVAPAVVLLALSAVVQSKWPGITTASHSSRSLTNGPVAEASWNRSLAQCREAWGPLPGPAKGFASREVSDRFVKGTPDVVIRNATIWTGNDHGKDVIQGDVWLSRGIVKAVGSFATNELAKDTEEIHADGAWLTPGIFDMASSPLSAPLICSDPSPAALTHRRRCIAQPLRSCGYQQPSKADPTIPSVTRRFQHARSDVCPSTKRRRHNLDGATGLSQQHRRVGTRSAYRAKRKLIQELAGKLSSSSSATRRRRHLRR